MIIIKFNSWTRSKKASYLTVIIFDITINEHVIFREYFNEF